MSTPNPEFSSSGWTVDTTDITADSTYALTDGTILNPPSATPYLNLITSEHNQQPDFMRMVAVTCGAVADISTVLQSLPTQFDLNNAVGAQLNVCGLWVGQSRVIEDIEIPGFFGFPDDTAALTMGELGNATFNTAYAGIFYELGETYQQSTTLSDGDYQTVIRARIVRNQYTGDLAQLEEALAYIFGIPVIVNDIGDLTLGIVLSAPISAIQTALLTSLDLLPRPAGVSIGSITYSSQ